MPLSYRAQQVYHDEAAQAAIVAVYSNLTFYRVVVQKHEGTIVGPGVEHPFDRASGLSAEAEALCAVIRFESENMR